MRRVVRVYAHEIHFRGRVYRHHVAELQDDGRVVFEPFEGETAFTTFVSGRIELVVRAGGLEYVSLPGPRHKKVDD